MKTERQTTGPDEVSMVKLYMNLTGATESVARGVFMHAVPEPLQSLAIANAMAFISLEPPEPVETQSAKPDERRAGQQRAPGILPRLPTPLASVMAS
jgi:hypothetical protein